MSRGLNYKEALIILWVFTPYPSEAWPDSHSKYQRRVPQTNRKRYSLPTSSLSSPQGRWKKQCWNIPDNNKACPQYLRIAKPAGVWSEPSWPNSSPLPVPSKQGETNSNENKPWEIGKVYISGAQDPYWLDDWDLIIGILNVSPPCLSYHQLIKSPIALIPFCIVLIHWLGAGGKGDDRGWDGWMASPTWWTWVWVNSGSWWWTGRPSVLQFKGLQRVGHDWVTELNWTEYIMLS